MSKFCGVLILFALLPSLALGECRDPEAVYTRALSNSLNKEAIRKTQAKADAPTAGTSSTAVIDSAQRPNWFAMALQQGLVKENDAGAISFSVAPFAWATALRPPEFFDTQTNYEAYANSRRLTGTVSFGGKGDAIENSDGTTQDAETARKLSDSVALEIQYRFFGSRDRRDYFARPKVVGSAHDFVDALVSSRIGTDIVAPVFRKGGENFFLDEETCDRLAQSIMAHPDFGLVRDAYANVEKSIDEEIYAEDGGWVWSVAAVALERKSYLGPDKWTLALRGIKGLDDNHFDFNFEAGRIESLDAVSPDIDTAKLAVSYTRPTLSFLDVGAGNPRFTAALNAEYFRHAPSSAPANVATLGLEWVFPLTDGVSIPFSISWANHTALISDRDEVIGHIGINLDLDGILQR